MENPEKPTPKNHSVSVYLEGDTWKVSRPDNGRVHLHDTVTWNVVQEGVTAHLQFTDALPEHKDQCIFDGVDTDWQRNVESGAPVTLTLRKGVPRGSYHYAAWITPAGQWAIGDNPPPQIDTDRP
ncbi:MAG: hypothetical protein V3V49_11915 [Candidatus Krumholzibacteria bacterium]